VRIMEVESLLSPFEAAYGCNPRHEDFVLNNPDDVTGEKWELEKVRVYSSQVSRALGTNTDLCLSTMQVDRLRLSHKKFALVDLSGTLHVEDEATPNAPFSLARLRCAGVKVLFVTNTTKESRRVLHQRLSRLCFDIKIDEIFTSLDATRNYLVEKSLRPMLLIDEKAQEDLEGMDTTDPNAVVIGLSPFDFNHETLSKAFRLVMEKDAEIVAVHKGSHYLTASGMNMGPGCFAVALERASGKQAVALGKPEQNFYAAALKYIGCDDPSDAVMIGDDVRDDVYGAMKSGITGMLVKTGKWTPYDEKRIAPHKPDFICDNFASAVQLILDEKTFLTEFQTRCKESM